MGIDAEIHFELDSLDEPTDLWLPSECQLLNFCHFTLSEATHTVDNGFRYYGIGYERGPWPKICGILMSLFASKNVKRVWYFGDNLPCLTDNNINPITVEDVLEISRHYMTYGERPYREYFK